MSFWRRQLARQSRRRRERRRPERYLLPLAA
jgi:hypothetical protein